MGPRTHGDGVGEFPFQRAGVHVIGIDAVVARIDGRAADFVERDAAVVPAPAAIATAWFLDSGLPDRLAAGIELGKREVSGGKLDVALGIDGRAGIHIAAGAEFPFERAIGANGEQIVRFRANIDGAVGSDSWRLRSSLRNGEGPIQLPGGRNRVVIGIALAHAERKIAGVIHDAAADPLRNTGKTQLKVLSGSKMVSTRSL